MQQTMIQFLHKLHLIQCIQSPTLGSSIITITPKIQVEVLPNIVGKLVYSSLKMLVQVLYGNDDTLKTKLGGGVHGHIGLIIKPSLYSTLLATQYVPLEAPGTVPVIMSS